MKTREFTKFIKLTLKQFFINEKYLSSISINSCFFERKLKTTSRYGQLYIHQFFLLGLIRSSFPFIFLFFINTINAQNQVLILSQFEEGMSIQPYLEMSNDYTKDATKAMFSGNKFARISQNIDSNFFENKQKGCTWFRFSIKNDLPTDTTLVLAFWDYTDWIECFTIKDSQIVSLGLVGEMAPIQNTSLQNDKIGIRIPLQAKSQSVFFLRNLNYYGYATFKLPIFYSITAYQKKAAMWELDFKLPMSALLGIFLAQIIFLFSRILAQKRFQLAYCLYILCCINFIAFIVFQSQFVCLDIGEFASSYGGRLFCAHIGTAIYGFFYISLLEWHSKSPWRFWVCGGFSMLTVIVSIVGLFVSFRFEGDGIQYYCNKIYQICNIIIFVVVLTYLVQQRKGFTGLLLYGLAILFLAYCWVLFINYFDRNNSLPTYLHPHIIIMVGVIIESFFFISALIWRDKDIRMEREQEIMRERYRIASDLHDDVGSSLSNITLLIERIKAIIKGTNPEIQILLDKISKNVQVSLENTQAIVWSIDSKSNKLVHLVDLMKEFTGNMAGTQEFKWQHPSFQDMVAINLTTELKKNLYLIFKESVNNAVKYAQSSVILIDISANNKILSMSIQDFGKGFDKTLTVNGMGLNNISDRAKSLNCIAVIHTELNIGTTIYVKISIP